MWTQRSEGVSATACYPLSSSGHVKSYAFVCYLI